MAWKVTAGLLYDAVRDYPEDRRDLGSFPPGPTIFLTGTHRSGTTWVGGMLAERGLWYLHEPFNPNKRNWQESFTYANPASQRADIDRYVTSLLAGKYRATSLYRHSSHPLMPLRIVRPRFRRMLIKDPLACLLAGYLAEKFDFQTRVLFRHPAGFVSSVCRLGWPTGKFLGQFLKRTDLMADHLEPYRDLMQKYQDRNDVSSATVLYGVLSTVLWNQVQANRKIRWYRFEDLCDDPIGQFRDIFADLSLPYTLETEQRHRKMCFGDAHSPTECHTHSVVRNSRSMADSWRRQLDAKTITQIRHLWDSFNVSLYRDPECWTA